MFAVGITVIVVAGADAPAAPVTRGPGLGVIMLAELLFVIVMPPVEAPVAAGLIVMGLLPARLITAGVRFI